MPVMRTNSMTFDASVPVLVVGGGGTGMTAALAAADAGAEVMVLERDATPTGTTSMAQGFICAAATKAQREKGVHDTADAMFADIMKKTRGETDQALARTVARECGPTIDWSSKVGLSSTRWPTACCSPARSAPSSRKRGTT